MHSGCKKLFPSCLPLSTGADVFTSAGWLLSCWGQGTSRKSHLPVPTTQESKPQVLIAFVGKFIEKFCKNGLKSELNLQWVPPRNQHCSQAWSTPASPAFTSTHRTLPIWRKWILSKPQNSWVEAAGVTAIHSKPAVQSTAQVDSFLYHCTHRGFGHHSPTRKHRASDT